MAAGLTRPRRCAETALFHGQGCSERRGESYSAPYVEPLSDARTKLADLFSILLEAKLRQTRVVVRPWADGPEILAICPGDCQVIDTCDAPVHEAVVVEFPILVSVRSKPISRAIVPLVSKAHGDSVTLPGPQLLDETVIQLPLPFLTEKADDRPPT